MGLAAEARQPGCSRRARALHGLAGQRCLAAALTRRSPACPRCPRRSFSAGVWARMGGMRFVRTAWADSPEAIQFAVTGTHVSPPGANVVEDVL